MELEFDVLGKALWVLSVCGLNPKTGGVCAKLLKICTVVSVVLVFVLNVLEISLNWDGINTLSNAEYLPITLLDLSKMVFLAVNKDQLKDMLRTLESFWDPKSKFGQNAHERSTKNRKLVYRYFETLLTIFILCSLVLSIFPLLNRNLIFSGYKLCNFSNNACYFPLYFWHVYLFYLQYFPVVLGFDGIFASFILYSYIGIDLIKIALQNRQYSLKAIVDQHNVILNFIKAMDDLYHNILLVQFWASLGSLIFCLYMLTLDGIPPSFDSLSKYGLIYLSLVSQLAIYSIGGSVISNQTFSVADSAFYADWHGRGQTDFRKSLSLIILRSQKGEKITIGKISDLNLDYFLKIVKSSISVYALLRTVALERQGG